VLSDVVDNDLSDLQIVGLYAQVQRGLTVVVQEKDLHSVLEGREQFILIFLKGLLEELFVLNEMVEDV
jgi:hypothetical protein